MGCHKYFSILMQKTGSKPSIDILNTSRFMGLILLAITSWNATVAISLDTYYPLIFEGFSEGSSYFGYSVLLYSEPGKKNSWIQVGAPRANQSFNGKMKSIEPGSVYRCQLSPPQLCKPIVIPGKEIKDGKERRDGSWMGAAMDVQPGPYGEVVVCSPRWTHVYGKSHFMPGACYLSTADVDANKTFEGLFPLLNIEQYAKKSSNNLDFPYFAYGEAGLSVHFPLEKPIEASSKLVIGVPGLYNWRGGFVLYERITNADDVLRRGNSLKLLYPTTRVKKFKDGDYTGYQVNSGYILKEDKLVYVVGAPRAETARGKVFLLYINMKGDGFSVNVKREVMGIQCGEYFGTSIAVGDLNGDSYDDLIVGAPFYCNDDIRVPDYDRGRIAIYLSVPATKEKEDSYVTEVGQIIGYKAGGRFGSAVVFLGDINSDGMPEIAVGAPYEDDNRGAVYIYSSNADGRLGNPIQRISAKDSYDHLKGFGISISPHNVDIDGNGCPDVAIGAYLSGHAVIFRGKPVIKWSIQKPEPHPNSIPHNATQFFLKSSCATYFGSNAPNSLRIQRTLELDFRCKNLTITDEITLHRGEPQCHNFTILLKPITDFNNPIKVKISYELLKNEEDTKSFILVKKDKIHGNDSFCEKCPVSATSPSEMLTIPFEVDCGGDDVCTADLTVAGAIPELENRQEELSFVTGSLRTLLFQVTVSNNDPVDIAYFTRIYIGIGVPGSISRFLAECHEIPSLPFFKNTLTKENDNSGEIFHKLRTSYIECETGNISPGEEKNITLELDMTNINGHDEMMLAAWATTVNTETNPLDNKWQGKVLLKNEADIAIFGKGDPEISSIVLESENETQSRMSFLHNYEVQKFGHSQVEEVSIELLIPMYITEKKSMETIQFLTIRDYKAYQGRQTLPCSMDDSMDLDDEIKPHSISKRSAMENASNHSRSEVPSNRTLYVNCSSPEITDTHLIECVTVSCILGPLSSSQTIAKVLLKMEIEAQKLNCDFFSLEPLMGARHIIFLNTHGIIKVVAPANLQQPPNDKPDHAMAHSIFIADVPKKKLETWIFAVAIGVGVMIVLFLQMALAKAGFFKRKKKQELKALKRQTLLAISEEQERLREKSEEKEDMQDSVI